MRRVSLKLPGSEKREFQVALRRLKQFFQPIWIRKGIGIEQSQPVALYQACPKVVGGGKTPIFDQPLHVQGQPWPAASHSIQGAIRGTVVHHDDLEIFVGLLAQTRQTAWQVRRAVPSEDEDRETGCAKDAKRFITSVSL